NRNPAEGGKVLVDNIEYAAAITRNRGVQVAVTAVAATDYVFTGWSGASTSTNATVTLTMNSDLTLTATFEKKSIAGTDTFTDTRDGKTYRTVKIGTQTWMAQNLNYDVPGVDTDVCYNNSPDSCAKYGRLYDWATVMGLPSSCNNSSCASEVQSKHQGICPNGWHIPSRAEWDTLVRYVDPNAGTKLKSSSPDWNGTDDYGFSALPGGNRFTAGSFGSAGSAGLWWSATENGSGYAYGRSMYSNNGDVVEGNCVKSYGFSALCVWD
ncbi:MAG: hypothetical protein FWC23_07940, partial [Chitinispirillia bacterium]|nr:hypothetical protein [Chitinispirillia bacterium]MCL2269102.1 hypothetical protein [Chitinispirillia bacterium]